MNLDRDARRLREGRRAPREHQLPRTIDLEVLAGVFGERAVATLNQPERAA
jgi:hypothetical protein